MEARSRIVYSLVLFIKVWNIVISQGAYECVCVIYYQCRRGNGTVITDGEGIFDERIGDSCLNACNPACAEEYACCRLELNSTDIIEKKISTTPFPEKARKGCGFRNREGVGFRINTDGKTNFGEFPWMVGIVDDNGAYRCGGSLIHPSVVMTAAHCVIHKKNYVVRAGEWDSSNTREILKHRDIRVSSIKIHENYSPAVQYNDIALLFLNSPFDLKPHINTICLPSANATIGTDRCHVTGWGKDKFGSKGQYPAILKKIDLPLVPKNTCETNLRQTRFGQYFNLHRSALCAGGEIDKDACIGDGGGPLVCPISGEEEKYQQVGIVSWGVDCNQENVPGVYGNVQFFREWIDRQMQEKNFDISSYQH